MSSTTSILRFWMVGRGIRTECAKVVEIDEMRVATQLLGMSAVRGLRVAYGGDQQNRKKTR